VGLWTATVEDSLCTLQEVFENVDQSVGFNIEVKFHDVLDTSDEELRRVIFPILEVRTALFNTYFTLYNFFSCSLTSSRSPLF
jgi:hypothetical protein